MDMLENIEREYNLKMELIDAKLAEERAVRELSKALRREQKIKDLVRHLVILVIAVVGVVLIGYSLFCGKTFHKEDWEIDAYVVESGDTLWNIGEEVVDSSTDIREWVHEVMKLNDMESATLYPRDVIVIYVPKEEQ